MGFDMLRSKIVEERDTILFDEAIICLNGGALRAAYITTWIATAESLKFKFYDMSSRDHEIKKKVIGKLEEFEQKQKPTDSLLIRSAEDFGLITSEQRLKLEHMKSMRGVYAHPLSTAPSENEVRLAIELSVNIVLSQPALLKHALLKHAFVSSLVTSIFENHHYLDDSTETVQNAATSTLNHIHPAVFSHFFKLLIENLNKISGDITKELFRRRGSIFLDTLLKNPKSNFSAGLWKIDVLLHKYPLIITKIFVKKDYWILLDESMKDSILGYLIEPIGNNGEFEIPSIENLTSVLNLYNGNLLNDRHTERFKSTLEKCDVERKVSVGVPLGWYQEELISDLKTSNWYAQNPVVEAILALGVKKVNILDSEFLIELGRNILQAADGGAREAEAFVKSLSTSEFKSSPYLVEGVFLETFINENKRFRFKKYRLESMMAVITAGEKETERILNNAMILLENCSQKSWFQEKTFEEYLELLAKIIANEHVKGIRRDSIERFNQVFIETRNRFKKEEEQEDAKLGI
ncbi:hypothetical protein [Priestia megaterium]|uniref:hypothetical protein n=1 Tax=Priestia megaterium TaxID=1404 RepID=UPI0035B66EE6